MKGFFNIGHSIRIMGNDIAELVRCYQYFMNVPISVAHVFLARVAQHGS